RKSRRTDISRPSQGSRITDTGSLPLLSALKFQIFPSKNSETSKFAVWQKNAELANSASAWVPQNTLLFCCLVGRYYMTGKEGDVIVDLEMP
ncbi:MAG: hypothetical protein ACK57V_16975, partial [Pirellula sp.]